MKKILILAQFVFVLNVYGQKTFELNYKYSIEFDEEIEDVCEFKRQEDSILNNPSKLETEVLRNFVILLNENVVKGKHQVFDSYYQDNSDFGLLLDSKQIAESQIYPYVVQQIDRNRKLTEYFDTMFYDYTKTAYLRLKQEWYYNEKSKEIEVIVNGYSPVLEVFDLEGCFKGWKPMYWSKQYSISSPNNPSRAINDTSVVWASACSFQIPVNPSQKSVFRNDLSEPNIKKIYDLDLKRILFMQAQKGELEIYNPSTGKKIPLKQFNDAITVKDTFYMPSQWGDMKAELTDYKVGLKVLGPLIVNQTFIFNEKNFTVESRINSIILTRKSCIDGKVVQLFEVRFSN